MSLGRRFKLNSGYEIPAIGLGTWVGEVTYYEQRERQTSNSPHSSPSPMKSRMRLRQPFAKDTVTSMPQPVIRMRMK